MALELRKLICNLLGWAFHFVDNWTILYQIAYATYTTWIFKVRCCSVLRLFVCFCRCMRCINHNCIQIILKWHILLTLFDIFHRWVDLIRKLKHLQVQSMLLQYHCRNWGRILIRVWTHIRHSIPLPEGRAIGWMSFVNMLKKFDRVIMAP